MAGERWTLILMDGDHGPVRQISVSRARVRAWAAGAVAAVVLVFGLAVWVGLNGSSTLEAGQLRQKNALLAAELTELKDQVERVEGSLAGLVERNAQVRTLAGLDPIDGEVLQVGVGGPGGSSLRNAPLWSVDSLASAETFALAYDLSALERRARLLTQSFESARDSLAAHRALLEATPSILPTSGWLSSSFSSARFHPIHSETRPHHGIDVAADHGTPILAAAKGRVTRAGWMAGLGQTVEIDHGYGYVTRYAHASKILVRVGEEVTRGQMIAQVGSTGIATGPHLHYEVKVNGVHQNPMNFVIPAGAP